jgi:predicted flap endonuclease-1-like 5' DNA nuclease
MNWLSFLIGALIGWLIGWLIDYLICRPRRMAAEADLRARLETSNRDSASLKAQLAGMKDLQVRLDGANSQVAGLQAQLGGMKGLQADLDACRAQATQYRLDIQRLSADLAASRVRAGGVGAAPGVVTGVVTGAVAATATGIAPGALAPAGTREAGVDLSATPTTVETREVGADVSATRAPGVGVAVAAPEPGKPDDLTIVEGIGVKINALLNQNGIYTFAQLADASVERLRSILVSGGSRFRIADPQTWSEQARLARDGQWDAIKGLQDSLKGGRTVQRAG